MIINKLNIKISSAVIWLIVSLFYFPMQSQDLEPRFLSSIPTGANIIIASYGYSKGNILLDPSAPIEDLNAELNNAVFAYASSFKLFNKLTKFDIVAPYSFAKFNGALNQIDTSTTRNGFGDPLLRVSMILKGSPPLKPSEFIKHEKEKFKLGVFIRVRVPIGQYDPNKLINLGTNRWAFKTGIAGSYTIKKKLIFEAHLNSWFFTKNNNYFGGNSSFQQPIYGAQFHTGYIFKPGVWIAGSIGKTYGGKIEINDVKQEIDVNNSRYGLTFAYRVAKKHTIKTVYTNGFSTRAGTDFNTFLLVYQFVWFNKNKSSQQKGK